MSLCNRLVCFARFCWNDSACSLFPATTNQLFSDSLSSHLHCSCLEIFSRTNNFCKFWRSKFQQVRAYAFCSWGDKITQQWYCCSPKNSCKFTTTATALSANTSIEWNLYLCWSNDLVTSFRWNKNVGSFLKDQKKTSDTDKHKGYFFTARVSQVNVNIMERLLEQWSELQVAKCLIVHILSNSYNVSNFEIWSEKKTTQQWGPGVTNDIVLNQVRVCHERVYADNVISKFWFVRSFFSQHYSKFIAHFATQKFVGSGH